jgi:hypothetical protein
MGQYKATYFFQSTNGLSGWTEIFYPLASTPGAAGAAAIAAANLRKEILHADCSIVQIALSDVSISGDSLSLLGAPIEGTVVDTTGYLDLDSAVLVKWTVGVWNRNKTYLRGFPVSATKDGKYTFAIGINDALDAWILGVIPNFVFRGRFIPNLTPPPAYSIGYQPATDGRAQAKLARRKAGRPFGLSRGRRLAG